MNAPDRLTISVIVPVHKGALTFAECLASLQRILPPDGEIIAVVDGEEDNLGKVAEAFGARTLMLPKQGGPARARNMGARTAGGEILFFVDADVVVHPDAIEKLLTAFSNDVDLAALFGSYDDAPPEPNFLSQYKNLLHHYTHQTACEEASTFWSGCGAIRRHVFLAIGGFDESYRQPCIEDIELGYRLRKAGYRTRLYKDILSCHLKHWTALSLLKSDLFQRAMPWTQLILRDRQLVNDLNTGYASRISIILVYSLLGTLLGSLWQPKLLILSGLIATMLYWVNRNLYHFFQRKRGLWFAARVVPWHWLYFLYSGLAFLAGVGQYWVRQGIAGRHSPTATPKPREITDT